MFDNPLVWQKEKNTASGRIKARDLCSGSLFAIFCHDPFSAVRKLVSSKFMRNRDNDDPLTLATPCVTYRRLKSLAVHSQCSFQNGSSYHAFPSRSLMASFLPSMPTMYFDIHA